VGSETADLIMTRGLSIVSRSVSARDAFANRVNFFEVGAEPAVYDASTTGRQVVEHAKRVGPP
jgi:hypothetical protein